MRALFVHDHVFPRHDSLYFESYGFDKHFFNRYLEIFNNLEILARDTYVNSNEYSENNIINEKANFYTISSYKKLFSGKIRNEISNLVESVDALIIRLPSNLGLYALNLAVKKNKPYIIELVGCPFDAYWYMSAGRKVLAPIMYLLTRHALYNSKYNVYVTDNFLQKRYPSKGESISCSNVTIKNANKKQLVERLNIIDSYTNLKSLTLGTIGTIDSIYKGQQYIFHAISELKKEGYSIEYHLVGGGNENYLKELSKKLDIEDNVKFFGKLEHKDIFKWLSKVDIYVQPSDTEGLPRSVIEAMSMSCPVIGSNAGGIPELIDESVTFEKGNIKEFIKIYKNLNKNELKRIAEVNHTNSKKYLESKLSKKRKKFFGYFKDNEIEGAVYERAKDNY